MKQIRNICLTLLALLGMAACGEDRSGEYYALVGDNMWIEEMMLQHYLWYDSIPEVKENDYFAQPQEFLKKLLYTQAQGGKGDNYSYLETDETDAEARSFLQRTSTYGFDFELMSDPTGTSSHIFARILFVLPDSPASEAGLERGNWISAVGKEWLTTGNYGYLMQGGRTSFARESLVFDEEGKGSWVAVDTVEVGAARPVELDPFYVNKVYAIGGMKIAYMVYNEFATGPDNLATDMEYRDRMRSLFAWFKSEAPDAFILDLRYNPGGYLSCAADLASYLAPASALGKTFCTLRYNDITEPQQLSIAFDAGMAAENLNLSKLYVLTSKFTASASEAVINCLRPYMGEENIIIIGETTEGKNVAMSPFENEEFGLTLWPVIAYVQNAEGDAGYSRGIVPDFTLSERRLISPLYPLGDTREYLLYNTLAYITTGVMPDLQSDEEQAVSERVLYNSMSSRSYRGVIVK